MNATATVSRADEVSPEAAHLGFGPAIIGFVLSTIVSSTVLMLLSQA